MKVLKSSTGRVSKRRERLLPHTRRSCRLATLKAQYHRHPLSRKIPSCCADWQVTESGIRRSTDMIVALPSLEILEVVVTALEPEWRGMVKHVCRTLRDAVCNVEKTSGQASVLGLEQACCRGELLQWAVQQGCPWHAEQCLLAAAGERNDACHYQSKHAYALPSRSPLHVPSHQEHLRHQRVEIMP